MVTQNIEHSAMGRIAQLTFALYTTGGATAQSVADSVQAHFNTQLKALFDDQCTLDKPFVNRGQGTTTPQQAIAAGATVAGTRAGITVTPPQVACLVRKYSTLGGRKNRGRMYFPFILAVGDVDQAGVILPATVTTIQTAVSAFRTAVLGATYPLVIANKTFAIDGVTGKKYVTAITAGPNVSSLVCETRVATQRRRLVRV